MEDALVLARTSKSVTIIHRRDSFHRASHALSTRVLSHPTITVQWNTIVQKFTGEKEGDVNAVILKNVKTFEKTTMKIGAAFVAIGHDPNTKFLKETQGLTIDAHGYIVKDNVETTATSVEGVFASGDVADSTYRQAVTSAGSGARAALDAERWLSERGIGL